LYPQQLTPHNVDFTIDSGATDVTVPADVVSTLIRTGSITKDDFLGERQYQLADGSMVCLDRRRIVSVSAGAVHAPRCRPAL
jgi:hypothetical protein